jgi:hypothetical protein
MLLNMNANQKLSKKEKPNLVRKYQLLAVLFAFVAVVGFVYVFGLLDSLETHLLSSPKDYKSEEIANADAAKRLQESEYTKLIDENAEQFVSEPEEEVEEDTASIKEEVYIEPVEEEPVGEVF